ncbi:phosphate/phosphite/phosphonate ABC transporter substrate-binding protein, partial [Lactobacillus sp. XV13L]|nr:phosphate/phosphite/phosphonate ABC transporter substrate-binding protein [Lactobacillus sp. XV13L]
MSKIKKFLLGVVILLVTAGTTACASGADKKAGAGSGTPKELRVQ